MKTLITLTVLVAASFLALACRADPYLDVSLGSQIASNGTHKGQMPFWAEAGYSVAEDLSFGVGHQSNADLDGDETSSDHFFTVLTPCNKVYCKLAIKKPFQGDVEGVIRSLELGFTRNNLRFTGFYETNTSDTWRIHGLKFGATF